MTQRTCAICKRPADDPAYAPFCSKRCADVDLQRWFSGAYAVPAEEAEAGGDEAGGEAGRGRIDPL
jgi:endogenous inhibitor of DNA gyrase (YacG/DUF329 family)